VYTPDFDYVNGSVSTLPVVVMSAADDSTWSGQYLGVWVIGDYLFKSDGLDENGGLVMGPAASYTSTKNAVLRRCGGAPTALALAGRPGNRVRLALPASMPVLLRAYDTQGRLVATLLQGRMDAGWYEVELDAASGMHVLRLTAAGRVLTARVAGLR